MKKKIITIENKKQKIISYEKNISLMLILEKNHISIKSQCRNGFCGYCKIQLISGKIKYSQQFPIAYSNPGEIFPCCCTVINNIKIKI